MLTQVIGAIVSLAFDSILIFGLFGFPKMEVAKDAYATVLRQITVAIVGLILNMKKNQEFTFRFKNEIRFFFN